MPRVKPKAEAAPAVWREMELLTRQEAASILRVDEQAVDKLRRAGQLRDVKVGLLVRIVTRSVRELLGELKPEPVLKVEPPKPAPKLTPRAKRILDDALRRVAEA